ncbi:MAG: sialate O-acetylesterase [Planctomycetia bacterium]|nr:sialate O-acetylesterase [Planctomycetia bacterium]
MKRWNFVSTLLLVLLSAAQAMSDVRLPKTFTDNAVLQRGKEIQIWGWAEPGEKVEATFNGATAVATTDAQGKWLLKLPAMEGFCEGKDLVLRGKNEIVLKNVVVGEVWICSGQSNMEQPLNSWGQARLSCSEEEISGDYSFVRFNRAQHWTSATPSDELKSDGWRVCRDGVQKSCTACGFHFAVRLHKELGVPVGLIDSNWGGSNINSWIPDEGWDNLPETVEVGKKLIAERDAAEKCEYRHAGGMYYAMLAPWEKYAIRGAIWYQGCSNAGEGGFYYYKQKAMIEEWRKIWNQGDFPFYWVQLANFQAPSTDPNNGGWAAIRDAQTRCMDVTNSGQAVIIDIGEERDIHPRNKFDVGNRLARWALANVYGKNVVFRSPIFEGVSFDGAKAMVRFAHCGDGLATGKNVERVGIEWTPGVAPKCFALAGADKKFYWADAKIVAKETVELTSKDVPEPKFVRFAWVQNPAEFNLYSSDGLPATPFRTDN